MPRPANIRLSDLTLDLLTLGFVSSALYETKVDRSIIKGSPVGGLGVIITTENDVPRWDFHQFQMAYAKFEPGTGYRTQFNGRSGYEMIADNALNNAEFFDIRNVLDYRKEYFLDKMHFNASGCNLFAKLLGNYIKSRYT